MTVTDDAPLPQRAVLTRDRQGFGLAGLAERVAAVDGRLRAGPGIDKGWVVDARLPLPAATGERGQQGRTP